MQLSDTTIALLNFDPPDDIQAEMWMMIERWVKVCGKDGFRVLFSLALEDLNLGRQDQALALLEVSPIEDVCLVQKQTGVGSILSDGEAFYPYPLHELRDALGFPLLPGETASGLKPL